MFRNIGLDGYFFLLQVFGLYFMQTYIGIFYHALLHRNFSTLRKVLIQRLLLSEVVQKKFSLAISVSFFSSFPLTFLISSIFYSQVLENLVENSLPYLKYSYKKYSVR